MTLLKHYYEADEDPAVIRALAADWLDILSIFPQGAIERACRDYLVDEPKRRPTPGAIRNLCLKHTERDLLVQRASLPPPPEPERVRVTPEAAARILHEAGLTPQRLAAISNGRRMPPPAKPAYRQDEPPPEPTPEEIAARPYTPEQLARTRRLHGLEQPQEETAQ